MVEGRQQTQSRHDEPTQRHQIPETDDAADVGLGSPEGEQTRNEAHGGAPGHGPPWKRPLTLESESHSDREDEERERCPAPERGGPGGPRMEEIEGAKVGCGLETDAGDGGDGECAGRRGETVRKSVSDG